MSTPTARPAALSEAEAQEALKQLSASLAAPEGGEGPVAEVVTRVAEFLQLNPAVARGGGTSLKFLLDVSVSVSAELGHVTLPIGDILNLGPGSVVELDRELSQPIDLTVNGVPFARGEVVVVEDRFAIRIKELLHVPGKKGGR